MQRSRYRQVRAGRTLAGPATPMIHAQTVSFADPGLPAHREQATEIVQRARELRHSQAWIKAIVTGITDYALTTVDPAGGVHDCNAGAARITGCEAEATDGRSPERLLDRRHEAEHSGWSLEEDWHQRGDGSRFWGSCLIAPRQVAGEARAEERRYSLIIRDGSDRRQTHAALRRSVDCDPLTGLANRRAFAAAAELELQRWPRLLPVVMIDVDHFKAVNNRQGPAAGDAVPHHLAANRARVKRADAAHCAAHDAAHCAALYAPHYAANSAGRNRAEPWRSGLATAAQPAQLARTAVAP